MRAGIFLSVDVISPVPVLAINDAYRIGFFRREIGFHFDGMDVLGRARAAATPALDARIASHLAEWPRRGPTIVQRVLHVETTLRASGAAMTLRPRSSEEYEQWSRAAHAALLALPEGQPGAPQDVQLAFFRRKWAFVLGDAMGDVVSSLMLGALTLDLLDGAPDHGFLRAQAHALATGLVKGRAALAKALETTAFVHAFPPATNEVAVRAAAALATAPPIEGDPPHSPRRAGVEAALAGFAQCGLEGAMPVE